MLTVAPALRDGYGALPTSHNRLINNRFRAIESTRWYTDNPYIYPVKDMSIFDALKMFSATSVKVTCPKCAYASEQSSSKVRKNITMICPKCGHYFRPGEEK
jgi:ssDNA-binding Zn-finger/Zn-ribbon topoisomerase 1